MNIEELSPGRCVETVGLAFGHLICQFPVLGLKLQDVILQTIHRPQPLNCVQQAKQINQ